MLNKPHCLQQLCLSIRVYWWLTLNIYFRCFYVYVFASVYTCVSKSWHLLGWHVYLLYLHLKCCVIFAPFVYVFQGVSPDGSVGVCTRTTYLWLTRGGLLSLLVYVSKCMFCFLASATVTASLVVDLRVNAVINLAQRENSDITQSSKDLSGWWMFLWICQMLPNFFILITFVWFYFTCWINLSTKIQYMFRYMYILWLIQWTTLSLDICILCFQKLHTRNNTW